MNLLADEDIPREVVEGLRAAGHTVVTAADLGLRGAGDRAIFQAAQERESILLTRDVEFGDLRQYPLGDHCGVVLLRMPRRHTTAQAAQRAAAALEALRTYDLRGSLAVIGSERVRLRSPG